MNWLTPVLTFIADLAMKLVGPVLAYFMGKEHAEKKEAERNVKDLQRQAEIESSPPAGPDNIVKLMRDGKL